MVIMYQSCLDKQEKIKKMFNNLSSSEEKYRKIMELGKQLPRLDDSSKTDEKIVKGCQSVMYLDTEFRDGKVFFKADSDALISLGLAAILIFIYSGETPETILKCPPTCLEEIGIQKSLSPNRANGLYQIHLKMKQEALKCLLR